jgi:hypothetical protein
VDTAQLQSIEDLQDLFPDYEEAPLLQKGIYRLLFQAIRTGELDDTTFVGMAAAILTVQMRWLTANLDDIFESDEPVSKEELAYHVSHVQFLANLLSMLAAHPPSNVQYSYTKYSNPDE